MEVVNQRAPEIWNHAATDEEAWERVTRLCEPGLSRRQPLTVSSLGDLEASWRHWSEEVFLPVLLPCLAETYLLALEGRGRDIQVLDLQLNEQLSGPTGDRSRTAGRLFLDRLRPARGERLWNKFQTWTGQGATAGHFPVLFAIHGASFHVPLYQTVLAYVLIEWRSAQESAGANLSVLPSGPLLPRIRSHLDLLARDRRFLVEV